APLLREAGSVSPARQPLDGSHRAEKEQAMCPAGRTIKIAELRADVMAAFTDVVSPNVQFSTHARTSNHEPDACMAEGSAWCSPQASGFPCWISALISPDAQAPPPPWPPSLGGRSKTSASSSW